MNLLEIQKYIIGEIKEEDLIKKLNELLNKYLLEIKMFNFSKKYERELETYNTIIEIFVSQLRNLLNNKEDCKEIIKTTIFLGILLESSFQFFILVYKDDYKKNNEKEIEKLGIKKIIDFLINDNVFNVDNEIDNSIINIIDNIKNNRNIVHVFNTQYEIGYDNLISNIKDFYYILDILNNRISYKFEELYGMVGENC